MINNNNLFSFTLIIFYFAKIILKFLKLMVDKDEKDSVFKIKLKLSFLYFSILNFVISFFWFKFFIFSGDIKILDFRINY